MNRLTKALVRLGQGEHQSGKYHYPHYTEGCWGKHGQPLCWLCKFRYVGAIVSLFRRQGSIQSNSKE